jgi:hypothetical protein
MKRIFLLLLSALLIFACSSDDPTSDDSNQLFLEKYDSVVWLGGEIDYTDKKAFINSSKTLTYYSIEEEACFSFELEGTTETPGFDYERVIGQIEEETENSITIFFQFVSATEPFNQLITYTVTYDGSTYTLTENIDGNSGGATYFDTDDEVCF